MQLEHGKQYVLNSGLITPPLIRRHGGISFEAGDNSGLLWAPDGRFRDVEARMSTDQIHDMSVAAEFETGAT